MIKGYKYRIYPNKQQQRQIQRTFGCCRFVYNQTLALYERYEREKKLINKEDCYNYCTQVLMKQYDWLTEVDKSVLENVLNNLDLAFKRYFNGISYYPKFKSKHASHKSYTINLAYGSFRVDFDNNRIKLPTLSLVKVKLHRKFVGWVIQATVSQEGSEKYYVSLVVRVEHQKLPKTDNKIGIDVGIKYLVVTSNGEKYENPKALQKHEKKLATLQRQLAHKQFGSKNYDKTKKKIARYHEHIKNIRKNNLHQITHKIISENQVIVSEDLKIKEMLQKHDVAKGIEDASWYELGNQLEYKAAWNDRKYIKVSRYYASSQICSCCGYRNRDIKDLSIREWVCPRCGTKHDRDINAAKNILIEGLKKNR